MASGTGPCRSAPADWSHQNAHELGEDDLNVVLEALHPAAAKYLFLGVAMNVKINEIKKIQKRCCSDPDECLLEVLLVRLKQIPSLTWRDIDTALRSGPVGEVRLANRIREQYGRLYPSSQEIVQGKNSDSTEKSYSSEQNEDLAEEVSKAERYQKPLEQPREDEYPHSHRETPVRKTKGKSGISSILLSKNKSKVYESGGRGKQKTKAVDQSVSDVESKNIMVGDTCGKEKSVKSKMTTATRYVSEIGRKKSRKQAPKEVQRGNSATSGEEEPSSSSVYRKTREERKASTRKKVLDKPEHVLKKQYEVVIAKHKPPTTVQTESDFENSASGSEEEQSHTPEPKRTIIPAVKYSNENTETISVRTPGKTARSPTELKADRKRKLPNKHQLTPKHVRLQHYSATSGEESPSNHSGTEMSIDKSLAEQPNAENSDMEEEQHDTVRRKRVHSDSPPGSPPTSQGGTQSDSNSKRREAIHQRHHKRVKHRKKMKQESSSSSETDCESSSPESDMLRNLTESENKGLIKAFKRCFGELCLAIKNPEKAAAGLQAKRLLSCSMMESLLTSSESQQEKAIALVRALKKRIKSRPVRVFTIIEVFLHNEVLKEAGRELWNETGTQTSHFPDSTEV